MSNDERAQQEEAFRWELTNRPRPASPEYKPGDKEYGPECCANEDCEAPMPELRRRRGWKVCTDCQSVAEQLAKRRY